MKHNACTCSINNKETPLNQLLPQGHQDMLKTVHECMAQANDIHNEIIEREMKIEIRDGISDEIAIELVGIVVRQGRISKGKDRRYYCWVTVVSCKDEDYVVYVRDNRKTDCFVVAKHIKPW